MFTMDVEYGHFLTPRLSLNRAPAYGLFPALLERSLLHNRPAQLVAGG